MTYLVISTSSTDSRLENGPTVVGDRNSNPAIMERVGARNVGTDSTPMYVTDDPPCTVLNELERLGYRVVAMAGVSGASSTFMWTLHKP